MEFYQDMSGSYFPLYKKDKEYIKEILKYLENKISNIEGKEDELLFWIMRETKCMISPGIILKTIRGKNDH